MNPLNPSTRAYIQQHRRNDVRRLALNPGAVAGVDLAAALQQIEGWQRMRLKAPLWASIPDIRFPVHLSLEQCSSQETAEYKARLVESLLPQRALVADLTGGLGVDFSFLAPLFDEAVYVERNSDLCSLARHNFPLLGLDKARVVCGDGKELLTSLPPASLLFLDPARRDGVGRKVMLIEDSEPDVTLLSDDLLAHAPFVMLKLSPMLDIRSVLRALPHVAAVHVVAVEGEVKELLVLLQREWEGEADVVCADLRGGSWQTFAFKPSDEGKAPCTYASEPLGWLYEPSASLLKGGTFRLTAARFGLSKLAVNSHLYTSAERVEAFPGRTFRVEAWSGFGKKELKHLLQGLACANLTVRNFPSRVADLRKRLKLSEGGDVYLFATTLETGEKILARCRRPDAGRKPEGEPSSGLPVQEK